MTDAPFSIAAFPFLKTESRIAIGGLTFRSTTDIEGLSPQVAEAAREIADMLFLKDSYRIRSASFAVASAFDLNELNSPVLLQLSRIQSVVAYFYASPHEIFGDPFLSSEHASMAVLSPGQVFVNLVRPDFHVDQIGDVSALPPDGRGQIPGYSGLYNFRHPFWVARGSRLYGPEPHLSLNHAQDLHHDLTSAASHRPDYRLLMQVLTRPETLSSSRILTGIRWFNAANRDANDDDAAIANLAIAFESLLGLPQGEKTDRVADAIALLLGRTPRLDVWARQFYDARSAVIHQGRAEQRRFVITESRKNVEDATYHSLLAYGRQIFQLCLATLLVGSDLAAQAGLEEKLISNQERFDRMCKTLAVDKVGPGERLVSIDSLVAGVERYRFVADTGLQIETMVGATRLGVEALLACDTTITAEQRAPLKAFVAAKRSPDHFDQLEALYALDAALSEGVMPGETQHAAIVRRLIKAAWDLVFMHYFWLKRQRSAAATH